MVLAEHNVKGKGKQNADSFSFPSHVKKHISFHVKVLGGARNRICSVIEMI